MVPLGLVVQGPPGAGVPVGGAFPDGSDGGDEYGSEEFEEEEFGEEEFGPAASPPRCWPARGGPVRWSALVAPNLSPKTRPATSTTPTIRAQTATRKEVLEETRLVSIDLVAGAID